MKARSTQDRELAWERLAQSAALSFPDGRRVLVPFLGAGSRRWVVGPRVRKDAVTDWWKLLSETARIAELPPPSGGDVPLSAGFEQLVHAHRQRYGARQRVSQAEKSLAWTMVERVLKPALARHEKRSRVPSNRARFLALDFADRVDLCFDDLLGNANATLHPGATRLNEPRTACREAPAASHGRAGARAWHMHGHALLPDSLVLGSHRYGRSVAGSIRAWERFVEREHQWRDRGPPRSIGEYAAFRAESYAVLGERERHWLAIAIDAPVLLLGVGLRHEEWDLSWFLQMRARAHANTPPERRPWTFWLTREADVKEHRRIFGLVPDGEVYACVGKDWEDAWERLFKTFEHQKVDVNAY